MSEEMPPDPVIATLMMYFRFYDPIASVSVFRHVLEALLIMKRGKNGEDEVRELLDNYNGVIAKIVEARGPVVLSNSSEVLADAFKEASKLIADSLKFISPSQFFKAAEEATKRTEDIAALMRELTGERSGEQE